jgi:hypothetical protein
LYKQLQDINRRVDKMLQNGGYDTLPGLLHTHEEVMDRLRAGDACEDVGLLTLLMETRDQLADTTLALRCHRMDLAGRLKAAGTKRKLAHTYGRGLLR